MSDGGLFIYCSALARDAALATLPAAAFTENYQTFAEFAAKLEQLLPRTSARSSARDVEGHVGRLALLRQAASDALPGELEQLADSTRALDAAAQLITAWRGVQLRPEQVRAAAAQLASRTETARAGGTLRKLARLFELFEKRLGAGWADRETRERELLERLRACTQLPARLIAPGGTVTLRGFHRLAFFQRRIADELARMKYRVVHLPPAQERVGTMLFVEAPTPYAEAYEISRRVYRWIVDEQIPPQDIAVGFRDLGAYSQALHDVFGRLKIPFYERRGEPVSFQPLVRAALSAVDACADGLNRRALFRFLCAGPVDVAALAGVGPPLDPHALNRLALDAAVENFFGDDAVAPAAAWRRKLNAYTARSKSTESSRRADALCAIVERMQALSEKRTVASAALAWKSFFRWSEEPALGGKERLSLQELDAALDAVAGTPNAASEKVDAKLFRELLAAAVQERSVRSEGVERGGVRLLNFFDLRGLSFRRVVLGGMAEGVCPGRSGPDPLLGGGCDGALRAALARTLGADAAHLHPRLADEVAQEECALFLGAAACARESVLLTRPAHWFDGAQVGASEFWHEVRLEDAAAPPAEKAAPIHPAPPLAECLTAEERELRAAWVLGGGAATNNDAERASALAEFNGPTRLKTLAQAAAGEQQRLQSFSDHAFEQAQREAARETERMLPIEEPQIPDAATAARVIARLAPKGIGSPLLSPSDIERLAACPFKFFVDKICRLDSIEEPGEELSALDGGSLWHQIFSRFYEEELKSAAARGEVVAKLDANMRAEYLVRLKALAAEEFQHTEGRKFIGHPGFWKLHRARVERVLESWLACELLPSMDGFHPARVEFAFGPESGGGGRELAIPLLTAAPNDRARKLLIKGRMDRLDLKLECIGGKTTVVGVRIIDYKSGRAMSYKSKTKEESLEALLDAQLPVYLAAAIEHLPAFCAEKGIAFDPVRVWQESCAGYYAIKDVPASGRKQSLPLVSIKTWPLGALQGFLDADPKQNLSLYNRVRRAVTHVLNGEFPVAPQACSGSGCPARRSCRYVALPALEQDE